MINERMRELMLEKGINQTKLAERSGMSRSMISKILRGERGQKLGHETIRKLADALGTTMDILVSEEKPGRSTRKEEQEYMEFAVREPKLSVLADQALEPEQAYRDRFNLRYKLGPVYDILRHPATKTPMAVAVYGDWGTGKTTAMKWLHGLLDQWNQNGSADRKIKVRPVWFYPWKYDKKEDVLRGLIWEVVVNIIGVKRTTIQTVKKTARQFGPFLGRTFLHNLISTKFKAKVSGGTTDTRVHLADIEEMSLEYQEASHPRNACLNEFESSLRDWIESTLGKNERLVVFIDDLDRCMPEIALQVLKSLRLYLNIEKLVFVVGADRSVISKLVREHYKRLGLDEEKSKNYLAKMFQVEVQVEPTEQQISDFLDEQLKDIPYWKEPYLLYEETVLFRELIFKLAERNPREVKRLINSALMTGTGAVMIKSPAATGGWIEFKQGLQLFFVRKILDDRYTMASEIGSKRGIAFFGQWSQIVCRGKEKDPNFPCSLRLPADFHKGRRAAFRETETELFAEGHEPARPTREAKPDLSFAPDTYHPLLKNPAFLVLLHLLADEDLGRLMQIPYPTEATQITAVVGTSKEVDIIREAIARALHKRTDDLIDDDYRNIECLDLTGAQVSDLQPIKGLISLQVLNLSDTQVSNLEPIRSLTNLQELYVSRSTKVSDEQLDNLKRALPKVTISGGWSPSSPWA